MTGHSKKHLTIVIKLGTTSIVDEKTHEPQLSILSVIVETAVKLHDEGHKVVLVSSGAVGVGLRRMELEKRPKHLPQVQALAAIGQCRLMSMWDQLFAHLKTPVAQVLLTRNDIADRTQYLNAQNTFFELLNMRVIPIVNENDTLAVTEIKFGDNDTLSAITAGMVQADYLFLMTDVDCLYDTNPRTNPNAKAIEVIEDISDLEADVSGAGSSLGTGGMSTKIVAAKLATSAGVTTVITRASKPGNIAAIIRHAESEKVVKISSRNSETSMHNDHIPLAQTAALNLHSASHDGVTPPLAPLTRIPSQQGDVLDDPPLHTRFLPIAHPIRDRWFWILHGLAPHGTVYVDQGAYQALSDRAGLLPVGVVDVEGHFAQQEAVRIVVVKRATTQNASRSSSPSRKSPEHPPLTHSNSNYTDSSTGDLPYETSNPALFEVGRAVVNYAASEIRRIMGLHTSQIRKVLGYADSEYVAVRENIAFFGVDRSRASTPVFGRSSNNDD